MKNEEQKKRNWAIIGSLLVHGSLLLIFIIMLAWKEPNPPIPEYGIELNFGLQQTGSGNVQPTTTQPGEETIEEQIETETQEEVIEEVESTETDTSEPTETSELSQEATSEANQTEGPDVIDETPVTETTQTVQETIEEVEEESTNNDSATENTTQETVETASSSTGAEAEESNEESTDGNNQETGDQGNETGQIDAKSLMGESGSSNGAQLELSGWKWDFLPEPEDDSQESGKIVFQITVNNEGYIERIVVEQTTVTPSVLKKYREAVEELTFSKNSAYKPAPFSKGRITFIIKSN